MHPEIEKFWNSAGYDVQSNKSYILFKDNHPHWTFYFWLYKGKWEPNKTADDIAAYSDRITGPISAKRLLSTNVNIYYCYHNKDYSEEEMLRIIRLKSFL